MKPDGMIQTRVPEHIFFGFKSLEAGMTDHDAFARKVIREIGQRTSLHERIGVLQIITDPHPDPQRIATFGIATLKDVGPGSIAFGVWSRNIGNRQLLVISG